MEIQEGLKTLANKYSHHPWYDSVGLDKYGRYVVYVHTMNMEIMKTVEPSLDGKQVLMHYASSKPENMKKYITEYNWNYIKSTPTENKYDPLVEEQKRLAELFAARERDGETPLLTMSIKEAEERIHREKERVAQAIRSRDPAPVDVALKNAIAVIEGRKSLHSEIDSISLDELISELDRLEKICGVHGLESIFYEVHDGKNAVTNLGAKYPEVRRSVQKLYDTYGFDLIYEELEG